MALRWNTPIDTTAIAVADRAIDRAFLGVTLPSEESANAFVEKEPGAFWAVMLHYFGRSFIIGAGLAAAGARGTDLVKYSLAAGGAIEASVLTFAYINRGQKPLPSGEIADEIRAGKSGAWLRLFVSFVSRAIEVGIGLAAVGVHDPKTLMKYSLAASAAVELFVQTFATAKDKG